MLHDSVKDVKVEQLRPTTDAILPIDARLAIECSHNLISIFDIPLWQVGVKVRQPHCLMGGTFYAATPKKRFRIQALSDDELRYSNQAPTNAGGGTAVVVARHLK